MKREELHSHHGKEVCVTYGGEQATALLDSHDVTKACLKNILKKRDGSDRSNAYSVVYLTDRDIGTMSESGGGEIQSRISIPCTETIPCHA